MDQQDSIHAYMDLLLHTNRLSAWTYNRDLQLVYTSYPEDDYQGFDALFQIQVAPLIPMIPQPYQPRIVYSFFNIAWLVDIAPAEDGSIDTIHILGPTFTGENSYNELVKKMDERHLSIKTKAMVSKTLTDLPIVASNLLVNYAVQLHYLSTGQVVSTSSVTSLLSKGNIDSPTLAPTANKHHGIWASEQRFLQLFKDGNPDFIKAFANSAHLSTGVQHKAKDSLRADKNSDFVLLTLISRASIEGGVSPDIAYDLCDFFGQRIEDAGSAEDLSQTAQDLMQTYFKKVCESKQTEGISSIVKNCCDYIGVHINEKLSIGDLAERAGYSEYYFSRKFKQEMGCTITEYIMQQKIERAKVLLSTTNTSILDISIELSFNSRSYFSDTFQKIVGMAPGEYRKQNVRL